MFDKMFVLSLGSCLQFLVKKIIEDEGEKTRCHFQQYQNVSTRFGTTVPTSELVHHTIGVLH